MFILNTLPDYNAALPVFFYTCIIQFSDKLYLLQGSVDMNKPPEMISGNMTAGKWNKNTWDIFNYSNHLSMTRWILNKQFHLVQPCASIQDSLWGKLTAALNSFFFFSHPHCNIIFGEVAYIYNEGSLCPLGHTGRITICNSNGKAEFDRYMENKEPEAQQ